MLSIVFLCIYAYLNAVSNFLNHIRLFLVNGILASFAISSYIYPIPPPPSFLSQPIRFKFLVCPVPGLRTAIHFFVLRRFAVGVGKFYLLGSSGGQSG